MTDKRKQELLEEMCEYTLNQAQGFQKNMYVKTPLLETYKMEFNYPYYEPKKLLLAELEKERFKSISNNQLLLNLKQKIARFMYGRYGIDGCYYTY